MTRPHLSLSLVLVALLVPGPALAAGPSRPAKHQSTPAPADDDVIEIEVRDPRREWLFPGLDHPRVQAFFRSSSMVGPSLFTPPTPIIRPLVRASTIVAQGRSAADRRAAKKWARKLIAHNRPALEACYKDALQRTDAAATRVTFAVTLEQRTRGPIAIRTGQLGDDHGNECLQGVLTFATREAPAVESSVEVEIPVWFWLQTTY